MVNFLSMLIVHQLTVSMPTMSPRLQCVPFHFTVPWMGRFFRLYTTTRSPKDNSFLSKWSELWLGFKAGNFRLCSGFILDSLSTATNSPQKVSQLKYKMLWYRPLDLPSPRYLVSYVRTKLTLYQLSCRHRSTRRIWIWRWDYTRYKAFSKKDNAPKLHGHPLGKVYFRYLNSLLDPLILEQHKTHYISLCRTVISTPNICPGFFPTFPMYRTAPSAYCTIVPASFVNRTWTAEPNSSLEAQLSFLSMQNSV